MWKNPACISRYCEFRSICCRIDKDGGFLVALQQLYEVINQPVHLSRAPCVWSPLIGTGSHYKSIVNRQTPAYKRTTTISNSPPLYWKKPFVIYCQRKGKWQGHLVKRKKNEKLPCLPIVCRRVKLYPQLPFWTPCSLLFFPFFLAGCSFFSSSLFLKSRTRQRPQRSGKDKASWPRFHRSKFPEKQRRLGSVWALCDLQGFAVSAIGRGNFKEFLKTRQRTRLLTWSPQFT